MKGEKYVESSLLALAFTLYYLSWLHNRWVQLLSLLGIGLVGYYFGSHARWKLYLGVLILVMFYPLCFITSGLYYTHRELSDIVTLLLFVIPVYYLGFLARNVKKPRAVALFSILALVPLLLTRMVSKGGEAEVVAYVVAPLYLALLGFVGGSYSLSIEDILVPPLALYAGIQVAVILPLQVPEYTLLWYTVLTLYAFIYPVTAFFGMKKGKVKWGT